MSERATRTATQSIETTTPVTTVVEVLADPTLIPQWAPDFADRIDPDSEARWQAIKDGRTFSLGVAVNRDAGTVDYLREIAPGRTGGAYLRAIPRPGAGTVITMTLPLPADVDPMDTAATIGQELEALASIAERLEARR